MNTTDPIHSNREYVVTRPNKMCWSSIFAGAFVGVGLVFLLQIYSSAISLSAYSSSQSGASVIAVGGFLGLLIGTIAAMVTAGFVAGYLGRYHYYHISGGIIYGFITWTISLLMTVILAGAMMHYMNFYSNALTSSSVNNGPKIHVTEAKNDNSLPIPTHQNTTESTAKKVTPTELAWGGWIIFVLFFLGAISSCMGAICGMKCKKEEVTEHPLH